MDNLSLAALDSGKLTVSVQEIGEFRERLHGKLIGASDSSYDEARKIWNSMIDRKPGLIVRCAGADDAVAAVRFARDHGLLVSVRGGGHNIAGNALCDGGLVIDFSHMKAVRVDDAAGSAEFTLVDVTGVGPKNPGYVEGFLIELLDGDRLHLRFTFGGGPGRSGVENILVHRVRPG